MYVYCGCAWYPERPEEGFPSSGTRVIEGTELELLEKVSLKLRLAEIDFSS